MSNVLFKVVFVSTLMIGIGLCVGGAFLPPLAAPGSILLGVAIAMYKVAYSDKDTKEQEIKERQQTEQPRDIPQTTNTPRLVIEQNIGLFFIHPNGEIEPLEIIAPHRVSAPTPSRLTLT